MENGPVAKTMPETGGVTFTIIVPNYNYENYVGRTIDSVLAQGFRDFELIVVDDGSTDRSWEIISAYGDRIQALRGANQGAARICLMAARRARGRYIYILDSDDELKPDALATIAPHLVSSPAKIQFPLTPIDAAGAVIGKSFPAFPAQYDRARMLQEIERNGCYLTGPTSGIIYRADVIAAIKDVEYERYLDGVAYLLCPFMGEVVTIDTPLANYRIHGKNASGFSAPSPEWLATERERFTARLNHLRDICNALEIDCRSVPDGESMAYVLERRILEQIASERPIPGVLVARYLRRLAHSLYPVRTKLAASIWAVGALATPRQLRKKLLQWRYNPWSRPPLLRRMVSVFR